MILEKMLQQSHFSCRFPPSGVVGFLKLIISWFKIWYLKNQFHMSQYCQNRYISHNFVIFTGKSYGFFLIGSNPQSILGAAFGPYGSLPLLRSHNLTKNIEKHLFNFNNLFQLRDVGTTSGIQIKRYISKPISSLLLKSFYYLYYSRLTCIPQRFALRRCLKLTMHGLPNKPQ